MQWGAPQNQYHQVWWVKYLLDPKKLIAAIRWYDHRLTPGKWVKLIHPWKPYRGQHPVWRHHLKAARRILGVRVRQTDMTKCGTPERFSTCVWTMSYPAWKTLQLRFGFEDRPELDWLFDPAIEAEFKALDPKLKKAGKWPLSKKIGKSLLARTKEYLYRDLTDEEREFYSRLIFPKWRIFPREQLRRLRTNMAKKKWREREAAKMNKCYFPKATQIGAPPPLAPTLRDRMIRFLPPRI